MSKDYN